MGSGCSWKMHTVRHCLSCMQQFQYCHGRHDYSYPNNPALEATVINQQEDSTDRSLPVGLIVYSLLHRSMLRLTSSSVLIISIIRLPYLQQISVVDEACKLSRVLQGTRAFELTSARDIGRRRHLVLPRSCHRYLECLSSSHATTSLAGLPSIRPNEHL